MLNRRLLRIKTMLALYSFFQSNSQELAKAEKDLFKNIDKVHDLYFYLLSLLSEIKFFAEKTIEEGKNKKLPSQEELSPNTKFIKNKILNFISSSKTLKTEISNRKISWQNEPELIKKVFNAIKYSEFYKQYLSSSNNSIQEDKELVIEIIKSQFLDNELLIHFFEEKSIYWSDDFDFVLTNIIKTVEVMALDFSETANFMPLYKDEEDDKNFVSELFKKTIINREENEKLIADKTKNWEVDRIAMMDILLMQMALTEICTFSNVPIKVSLNEYIEISKIYSTPKSKVFINGILDKLVNDLKEKGKIVKTGRGLIE